MKTLILFFMTVIFGIFSVNNIANKKAATTSTENKTLETSTNTSEMDVILGNWTGTGYVTDDNHLEQYIEIQETNARVSNEQYLMVCTGKNPGNNFVYAYNKTVYFNHPLNTWYTKGTINDQILPDSRTILGENNIFSYSYYDSNRALMHHTTARDTDDSFTETQEKWGQNGWETTAWFRMTRQVNDKSRAETTVAATHL